MLAVTLRRLALTVPVLLLVLLLSFLLIQLAPGDPAANLAGDTASPAVITQVRIQLGLNRPLPDQLFHYMKDAVTFNFGTSFTTKQSVAHMIAAALPVTLSLLVVSMVFAVVIAVPLGVIAGVWRDRLVDRIVTSVSAVGLALPPFVVALALVVPLALRHSWFPATGYTKFAQNPADWLHHLILPSLALAVVPAAELARQIRGGLADVLDQDYVRTARAKGLPELLILTKHAFRNAAVPVVTVFGLQVGRIIGNAILIEQVFAMPGFGTLAYNAVQTKDYPLIRGVVLVSAVLVVGVNLVADLANAYINPKLRVTS